MPSFGLRVSTLFATILAVAVLAEAGAGSPTVPTCAAPAGGWKASNGARVTRREGVATGRAGGSLSAAERLARGQARQARARRGAGSAEPVQSCEHDARVARVAARAARAPVSRPRRALRAPSCDAVGARRESEPPPPPPVGPPPTVVGVPYTCTGPVDNVRVVGSGESVTALVNLAAGCTGTISVDLTVTPGGGDGVKVQAGAHDLVVGPSRVICQPGVPAGSHQDGVQVQGGSNVTFKGLVVSCPSSPGAAAFYIDGKDFPGISNVTCDGCDLTHMVMGALFTAPAPGSGVRNSRIHQGTTTHAYYEIMGSGAINENNTLVPRA